MSFKANPSLVNQLTTMGYTKNCATRALYYTQNCDVGAAVEWIIEHQDKTDVDAPFTDASVGNDDLPPEIAAMQAYLDETDFYKMVIVVNTELTMGTGKVSAQVARAATGTFKILAGEARRWGESLSQWEQFGETLNVVKGRDAQHLLDLEREARKNGACYYLVQDAEKTTVTPGAITALGIFGKNNVVDRVIDDLPPMD